MSIGGPAGHPMVTICFEVAGTPVTDRVWYYVPRVGDDVLLRGDPTDDAPDGAVLVAGRIGAVKWTDTGIVVSVG